MKSLRGRTALLTGASRGIGVYIARALAAEGMHLVLAARSAEGLERVAETLSETGVRTLCVPTDVADRDALDALLDRANEFAEIDALVNNAGIEWTQAFDRTPLEVIDQILEVNLRAPMALARRLLPEMARRGRGHIVNVASVAGLVGTPYNETYSASKHGLLGFTRSLRATAHGEGYPVGVSAVCPGFVAEAGMYEDIRSDSGVEAPWILGTSPPEQVAQAVLRSIVDDLPEVVVNSTPIRPLVAVNTLFPSLGERLVQLSGGLDFFKTAASKRSPES